MKNVALTTLTLGLFFATAAVAKVTALFHPYDPTLEKAATMIEQAHSSVDLALYNLDAKANNPVIKTILSEAVQKRIQSGDLQIRLIFEGYESSSAVAEKMEAFEKMGIDVRHLKSSKKMHHKFGVIDGHSSRAKLITGSANWSLWSYKNFNENVLFMENEPEMTAAFQAQFNLLWSVSKEVGQALATRSILPPEITESEDVVFNTDNFKIVNNRLRKNGIGYTLTKQIVSAIDQAESHIQIATTRLKLRPIYNALLRAAARGVKIDIVVTMGEYEYARARKKKKLADCADEFQRKCSTSTNFALFLDRKNFTGHKNVNVRLKYFHIKKGVYLNKQMHSKYMIVDQEQLYTGSFNWSYSAEFNHIENLVILDRLNYQEAVKDFEKDFHRLWEKNRDSYTALVDSFETALKEGRKRPCGFPAITMSYGEIDYLLATGRRMKKSLTKVCK